MKYNEENDLFNRPDKWPEDLKEILDKWNKEFGGDEPTYAQLNQMLKNVEMIGYTFDYYLTAEPYNLRPLLSLTQLIELEREMILAEIEDIKGVHIIGACTDEGCTTCN